MKHIEPYSSLQTALTTLDNGGRFYNFFSKAGDGLVDSAELSKVAGVIGDRQRMFLFFELALSQLDESDKQQIKSAMSPDLRQLYSEYAPKFYSPSEAKSQGTSGEATLIKGVPKFIDDKTKLSGFIMIPIMAGKVMTFSMIPIMEKYNVYEVYDNLSEQKCIIAHAKNDNVLEPKEHTFGGVLKQLQSDKQQSEKPELFLEAFYYC
ncbi:MAG: hypothetical protein HWE27_12975 [Gammaproteobacteria bacterium]|nr:hypothetical protein [Gammaproteobacteria bacterium]